jgi:hypothetical protein
MSNVLEISQKRRKFTDDSTISDVSIGTEKICIFLEDKDRDLKDTMDIKEIEKLKVYGETCIPYGVYEVVVTLSGAFGIWLPLLLNTKGFKGIRIHKGNDKSDTLGCPLTGTKETKDYVTGSTQAFERLFYIVLNHLTMDSITAQKLVTIHKKGKSGSKEFGEIFTKSKVNGQKIIIEITK